MRTYLGAIAATLASFLFVCNAVAAPYDPNLGSAIDNFLAGQGSPLSGSGSVFFSNGVFYNVDPRLIVAIAGAESMYGSSSPCGFDAWAWLPNACTSGFSSYTDGIQSVTQGMRQNYINQGFTSIPAIATQYCSGQCSAAWISTVTTIYTSLGGNNVDLTFPGSVIDFEQFSNSPSYFGAYTQPESVVVSAGPITASFYGGVTLSSATNLPGDQSTTYGSGYSSSGGYCQDTTICQSTIEIDFSAPVINFSVFVINGNTVTVTYTVVDDVGGQSQITLVSNFNSGLGTVALPATDRVTQVLISSGPAPGGCCDWDFFIDNVSFAPAP